MEIVSGGVDTFIIFHKSEKFARGVDVSRGPSHGNCVFTARYYQGNRGINHADLNGFYGWVTDLVPCPSFPSSRDVLTGLGVLQVASIDEGLAL